MSAGAPRRHRLGRAGIVAATLLVLLVVAAVVADGAARTAAEDRIRAELADRLPAGSTEPEVRIGRFSFLAQFLAGRLDRVDVTARRVLIGDAGIAVHAAGAGVPVDTTQPVRVVSGTIGIDAAALTALVDPPGPAARLTLDGDVIGYRTASELLGVPVELALRLEPALDAGRLVLTPVSAEVTGGGAGLDVGALLGDLDRFALSVCAAELLPAGVEATGVRVDGGRLLVGLRAEDLILSEQALATPGRCA